MLLTAFVFLIILSILVLIHEIGHFAVAKKLGIKVEEFGLGLPPRVIGKKIGETVYSINWLPFGGFVRLYGEEGIEPNSKFQIPNSKLINRAFYSRPAWQRSLVLIAGVAMNFLLALVVISFVFTQGVFVPAERVHVESVALDSPASEAGLLVNDIILTINNQPIKKSEELVRVTNNYLGQEVTLTILRGADLDKPLKQDQCPDCQEIAVSLTPRQHPPQGQGAMGVSISHFERRVYPWYQAPIQGMKESLFLSFELVRAIGRILVKLVSFQPVSSEVAGPVGIAQITGQAVKFGHLAVIELLGLLSLNLAIINILPFPALDGGRLLFILIEVISGRRIKLHWERSVHQIGMAILLALIALVTINDIFRLLGGG